MVYNYYKILGISEKSGVPEIKRAYRDLAKKYHPDHNRNGSGEFFIVLNEAYQVLSDPARRRNYDVSIGLIQPLPFSFYEVPITKADKRMERRRKNKEFFKDPKEVQQRWDPPHWVKISLYIVGFLFGISVCSFAFYFVATGRWPIWMLWVSFLGIIVLLDSFSGLFFGNTLLSTRIAVRIRTWFF